MHEVGEKTHWHEPTGIDRAGIGKFGRPKTPYDLFMESEGIPVFRDVGLKTVLDMPMKPWKRLGGKGCLCAEGHRQAKGQTDRDGQGLGERASEARLGHLSGGISREGGDFLTVYYAADPPWAA